jgi:trk system potassium uptake protein TrkH
MASDASALPRAIQWWRSLLEWVGGVGVVVLALALIRPAESGKVLMTAEAREHRIGPSFKAMGRRIWWLYGVLTAFSIILFALLGMPWWESLNHGMTGIATGGFTITSGSFADYGDGIRLAAVLIMLLGAVSFRTYAAVAIERKWRTLARDVPTLTLVGLFIAGVALLALIETQSPADRGLVEIAFQWASALGTCGFQTMDLTHWRGPMLLLLTIGMFIGGAAGSTTGGVKIDRTILVVMGPIWHMRRRLSTRKGVQYYVIDGEKVKELDALRRYRGAVALASLFVACIILGTFVLMLTAGDGYAPHEVLFEVTSAISNVGLSTGLTSASLPWMSKLTMIVIMWMGRLEITAVLAFIGLPIILATQND